MKFSYQEDRKSDLLLDILTDEDAGIRIVVSRLGAELISLARRDPSGRWTGFLYRDNEPGPPEKGWANHATVMGYYLHRLKNGRSIYRGHEIRGGTHGFLREKIWHRVEGDPGNAGALRYRITARDFSTEDYPLHVNVELIYTLADDVLTTTFRFENHESDLPAHVSFGLHPGFAATSFESFHLQMPAGKYRRYFSPGNFLSGETEEIDFGGGEMPFAREQLPGSYILEMVDVPEARFVYSDPPSGRDVVMDLSGVPYLTLWSDGGPFLCIEPCWGLTDHHEQRPFEEKDGIQRISPNEQLSAHFSMRPQLARPR